MPCHFFSLCDDGEWERAREGGQPPFGLYGKRQVEGEAVEGIVNVLPHRELPIPLLEPIHSQRRQSSGSGTTAPVGLCHCPPQGKGKGNCGNDCRKRAGPDEGQDGRGAEEGGKGQCQTGRTRSSPVPPVFRIYDGDEDYCGQALQEVSKPFREYGKHLTQAAWEEGQEPHPAWQVQQEVSEDFTRATWEAWQLPHPTAQDQQEATKPLQ